MSGKVTVVCACCSETLYECPLCWDWFHRPNVLRGELGVECCLPCYFERIHRGGAAPALTELFQRERIHRIGDGYDVAREVACA